MSLASRIAARSRRPSATVRLGGRRWPGIISLSRQQAFGSGISAGQVVGRDPPVSVVEGATTISWSWGYDGYEVAGFSGVVTKILQISYPNRYQLEVQDWLYLASYQQKDLAADPLNSCPASAAITQFLRGAGVPALDIPTLDASGSAWAGGEWVLGTLTPVAFANTTALASCQQICACLGYWLYCDASGTVRARLMERRPSAAAARTLAEGVDFLVAGPPQRERDASSVRNRVVVRGANTGVQGAQIWDEWQTGAGDRTLEFASALIEYVNESEAGAASCTGVAKRLLTLWSRKPNVIRVGKLKADPRLGVGATVAIQAPSIGYGSATPFFVYSLETQLDLQAGRFDQGLVLDGGTGSQGYTTLPAPAAAFSWRLVAETLNGVGVVEVFLDGSASQSFTGEVVTWSWASATPVASGYSASASGVRAMFVYPAATAAAAITLTVMDTSSKTGSITQTITLAGDALAPLTQRVISLALGSAWAVSPDGGAAWAVEAGSTRTLVPETGGGALLASSGAQLRQTADDLASASTLAATLGGTITALSATDGSPDRVWAAVGAALFASTDGGATFALWGTLPATVAGILEDPAVYNSVFVLAGATVYHSTLDTPGTAWAVLYAGPAGATARHLARGQSGATTWVGYTGTFVGSPLQRVEGPIGATWPVDVSPQPAEIRAVALAADELTVYAWDGEGRGWAVDSATGVATAITATLAAGETAQHALADPDDPIVYLATFGAAAGTTYKYFPLADALAAFYAPAAGQQAHRVGLGAPTPPPIELLILTDGATPGGVWHNGGGTWALKSAGLPSAWRWVAVAVSPFAPDTWLLLGAAAAGCTRSGGRVVSDGHSPLWITADAGLTWAEVDMADDSTPAQQYDPFNSNARQPIGFASDGSLFVIGNYGGGVAATVALWRGAASGLGRTLLTGTGSGRGGHCAIGGQDAELVLHVYTGLTPYLATIAAGASAWTLVAAEGAINTLAPVGLTRRLLTQGSAGTHAYADYRAAPSASGAEAGAYVAVAGGVAYVAGARSGVLAIPDPMGVPGAGAVVAAAGQTTHIVAADPAQARVAALTGSASALVIHYTIDGSSWAALGGPAGGGLRTNALAVIPARDGEG